jgi:hypothetical protein
MSALGLEKALGRPMRLISSSEFTRHKAAGIIEYAQSKIRESKAATKGKRR